MWGGIELRKACEMVQNNLEVAVRRWTRSPRRRRSRSSPPEVCPHNAAQPSDQHRKVANVIDARPRRSEQSAAGCMRVEPTEPNPYNNNNNNTENMVEARARKATHRHVGRAIRRAAVHGEHTLRTVLPALHQRANHRVALKTRINRAQHRIASAHRSACDVNGQ